MWYFTYFILVFRVAVCNDVGAAIKYIGSSTRVFGKRLPEFHIDPDYIHYELDLFNHETVKLTCPHANDENTKLDPLDENMFYNYGLIHDTEKVAKDGSHSFARFKVKIQDVIDTLVVKKLDNEAKWSITFKGEAKHPRIETMYFDCITVNQGIPLHSATFQINVMPSPEWIPSIGFLEMENYPFLPDPKMFVYYKQQRPGVELHSFCGKSATTLDYSEVFDYFLDVRIVEFNPDEGWGLPEDEEDEEDGAEGEDDTDEEDDTEEADELEEEEEEEDMDEAPLVRKRRKKPEKKVKKSKMKQMVHKAINKRDEIVIDQERSIESQTETICLGKAKPILLLDSHYKKSLEVLNMLRTNKKKQSEHLKDIIYTNRTFYVYSNYKDSPVFPPTCPKFAMIANGRVVRMSDIIKGLNIPVYSALLSIFDSSQYYTYRRHKLHCTHSYKDLDEEDGVHVFDFPAVCDFGNVDSLATDEITCSIFLGKGDTLLIRHYIDEKRETIESLFDSKIKYLKESETVIGCKECIFEQRIEEEEEEEKEHPEVKRIWFNKELSLVSKHSLIRSNPIYYATTEHGNRRIADVEKLSQVLPAEVVRSVLFKPNKVIEIHRFDELVTPKKNGTLGDIANKVASNSKNAWKFFSIPMHGMKRLRLSCADFYEDAKDLNLKLYPEGKNTIFFNVSDGLKHPSKLEVVEFQKDFATYGISLYKKPETFNDYDLEVVFDGDRGIWAETIKPVYFICAADNWSAESSSYAIIALDPAFNTDPIYGCGTNPGFFYNSRGKESVEKNCKFTLDDKRTIGFFCPSPIPQHFLQGDQQQWAPQPGEHSLTTNPYFSRVQCYDKSPNTKSSEKQKYVDIFDTPTEVGEVRSLWVFSELQFMMSGDQRMTVIECNCLDEKGEITATIEVNSGLQAP